MQQGMKKKCKFSKFFSIYIIAEFFSKKTSNEIKGF